MKKILCLLVLLVVSGCQTAPVMTEKSVEKYCAKRAVYRAVTDVGLEVSDEGGTKDKVRAGVDAARVVGDVVCIEHDEKEQAEEVKSE